MKRTFFVLALFFAIVQANAQNDKFWQAIPSSVSNVYVGSRLHAVITFDNTSFVEFTNIMSRKADPAANSEILRISNDTMYLSNSKGDEFATVVHIHLNQSLANTYIHFSDKAIGYFNNFGDGNVSVNAEDNSMIFVGRPVENDTLRCRNLTIATSDQAVADIISPIVGDTIILYSDGLSKATHKSIHCKKLISGDIASNAIVMHTLGQPHRRHHSHKKHCHHQSGHGSQPSVDFNFAWAFNNWGSNPFDNATIADAYELRTSFSSFQLELLYNCSIYKRKLHFGAGLGYESDIYHFRNPYITTNSASPKTLVASDISPILGDCSTRLANRYITLPIELTFKKGHFRTSIAVIPGLNYTSKHTGLKYKVVNNDQKSEWREVPKNFINPYKLDLRFTVGYRCLKFFIQPSLLPVFVNTDQKLYPIKIGFMI